MLKFIGRKVYKPTFSANITMEGIIINYRGSHKTQHTGQMIVKVENVETRDAASKLLKKTLVWTTETGKKINGVILSEHGNSGAIRVKFERGLPGQSVGTKVLIE
jgi:large subunit ribosomal protein L35Ae